MANQLTSTFHRRVFSQVESTMSKPCGEMLTTRSGEPRRVVVRDVEAHDTELHHGRVGERARKQYMRRESAIRREAGLMVERPAFAGIAQLLDAGKKTQWLDPVAHDCSL